MSIVLLFEKEAMEIEIAKDNLYMNKYLSGGRKMQIQLKQKK